MDNTVQLVTVMKNQAVTTSRIVAEYFGKRHDNIIRDIDALIAQMASVQETSKLRRPPMFQKSTYTVEGNIKPYPMYLMNRDGFTLLAMGFTGKKALQFKLAYIDAFNKLAKMILNKQNAEWLEKRKMNKIGNKSMTDALKPVVELAERQGSKNGSKIYMNVQRLQNKIISANSGQRDQLELWQMNALDTLQFIAKTIAAGLVAQGADWHQVYKDIKAAYENYSRLSFLEHRQEQVYLA